MPSCADPWLFGWRTAWAVWGSYLYAPEFVALLVHVGLVCCYWMTATGANHLVGLTRNLVATGPWPGLMTSGPDRSVESAHCRRSLELLVVGVAEGTVYIPLPFSCWHRTSTSAVIAMKSCYLVWADRISHTPQRCSGMSSRGSLRLSGNCHLFPGCAGV